MVSFALVFLLSSQKETKPVIYVCLNCSAIFSSLKGMISLIKLIDDIEERSQSSVRALRLCFSDTRNTEHSVLVSAQHFHQSSDRTYVGHRIMEQQTKDQALSGTYFFKEHNLSV